MTSQAVGVSAVGSNGVLGTNGVKVVHTRTHNKESNGVRVVQLSDIPELDAILIGAGFSAFTLLNR